MSNQLTAQQWGLCIGQKAVANDGVSGVVEGYRYGYILLKYTEFNAGRFYKTSEIKPILRTLDQITYEEKLELMSVVSKNAGKVLALKTSDSHNFSSNPADYDDLFTYAHVAAIDWLTAKGFDIRGWIEQGLAIKGE